MFISEWEGKADAVSLQSSVLAPNSSRIDKSLYVNELRTTKCPNPFRQMVIRANKDILPCCSFWGNEMPLCKYEEGLDLNLVLEGNMMTDLRSSFNGSSDISVICRNCLSSINPSDN
jgi:hypothetical protein